MSTIYLTRHGQTEWNLTKRLQGAGNSVLTDKGIEQAQSLKKRLEGIDLDVIITSPLTRAKETAKILRGNRDINIVTVEGISEISFGEYEGYTEEELLKLGRGREIKEILSGSMDSAAPGGETLREMFNRIFLSLDEIVQLYEGKSILIVSHGIALKGIVSYFNKEEEYYKDIMGQASLSKVIKTQENYSIEYLNDISHIEENNTIGW